MAEELHLILKQIKIFDNQEWFGSGELGIWSFVNSGEITFIDLPGFLVADEATRRNLVRQGVAQSAQMWKSLDYHGLQDNHTARFGNSGRRIYTTNPVPRYFDWLMIGIESDGDIRDLGNQIVSILPDEKIDNVVKSILALSSRAASPATAAATEIAKLALSTISSILKGNEDDLLFVVEQSFFAPLHYSDGFYEDRNCPTVLGRAWYSFQIVTFEY